MVLLCRMYLPVNPHREYDCIHLQVASDQEVKNLHDMFSKKSPQNDKF